MNSGTRYILGLGLGLGGSASASGSPCLILIYTGNSQGNSSSEFTQSSLVYILISGLPTILDVGELQTGNSEFTRFLGVGSLE